MEELRKQHVTLKGWLGFQRVRMRFVLMGWVTFHGMTSHVFQKSHAMAAESRKVLLEISLQPNHPFRRGLAAHFFTAFGGLRVFGNFSRIFLDKLQTLY